MKSTPTLAQTPASASSALAAPCSSVPLVSTTKSATATFSARDFWARMRARASSADVLSRWSTRARRVGRIVLHDERRLVADERLPGGRQLGRPLEAELGDPRVGDAVERASGS